MFEVFDPNLKNIPPKGSPDQLRLNTFYHKFVIDYFEDYKLGHFILAAYAAVPALLTPDLLYKLWLNFPNYMWGGSTQMIHPVAPADALLSSVFDERGLGLYEMPSGIRMALLEWLEHQTSGENVLQLASPAKIANFVFHYVQQPNTGSQQWGEKYTNLQEWTTLGFFQPLSAADKLYTLLQQSIEPSEKLLYIDAIQKFSQRFDIVSKNDGANSEKLKGNIVQLQMVTQAIRELIYERPEVFIQKLKDNNLVQLLSLEALPNQHGLEVEVPKSVIKLLLAAGNKNLKTYNINSSYYIEKLYDIFGWNRETTGNTVSDINNIPLHKEDLPSSLPSPLARIHLFENAMKKVTNQALSEGFQTLDFLSPDHLLVSDLFDVAEILFNRDFFNDPKGRIKIQKWDIVEQLSTLKTNPKHRLFAETFELYLKQNAGYSNFDKIRSFYIISCENNIIGGTSPSTLFFAAYNPAGTFKELGLIQDNDVLFDTIPTPLYKRSISFQRYLFGLFKVYPEFKKMMPILWSYLEVSLKALETNSPIIAHELISSVLYNQAYQLNTFENEFIEASLFDVNEPIEIFSNVYHRCKKAIEIKNYQNHELAMKSNRIIQKLKIAPGFKIPLVFQQNFSKGLKYNQDGYKYSPPIPSYVEENDLEKRILPGLLEIYPWVTISDFLEPCLMKLVFQIDQNHFFNGNSEGFKKGDEIRGISGDDSYLLPIKAVFFNYYDHEYLQNSSKDGIPHFRMIKIGSDAVRIELRLLVNSGEYITFERLYRVNITPNEMENQGAIIESWFNLGFFPLARVKTNLDNIYYHIKLVDADSIPKTIHRDYELTFFNDDGELIIIPSSNKGQRSNKRETSYQATTKDYILRREFAFIQVDNGDAKNILIPKFSSTPYNSDNIYVAVDFGTTNSHISIAWGERENGKPFSIREEDRQLISLHDFRFTPAVVSLSEILEKEIMPFLIDKDQKCWFPTRTALTEIGKVSYSRMTPIADVSIAFFMEKQAPLRGAKFVTNLKWLKLEEQADAPNNGRVAAFIGQLLLMVRNKIILNGNRLDRTRLIWFYPSSMGKQNVAKFDDIWNRLALKYISPNISIIKYPESFAPFFAHNSNVVKSNNYPVINIDIGGGTTDIAVFYKDKPNFITSFRFAGNSNFGDGYEENIERSNGFVRKFMPIIEEWLNAHPNDLYNLNTTLAQEYRNLNSADLNSFFFSIEENKEVRDAKLVFSYTRYLANNDEARIVFLVFCSAIIYHIAKLMRVLDLPMPRQILLSGKGANIFRLLDADKKLSNLENLTKDIFKFVYNVTSYHSEGLNFALTKDPKEATCQGGIRLAQNNIDLYDVDNIVLIGDRMNILSNMEGFNHLRQLVTHGDLIRRDITNSVVEEVKYFINSLFDICYNQGHFRRLEIKTSKLDIYKKILLRDAAENLEKGRRLRQAINVSEDDPVEETLFFYPLIGGIYELTQLLVDSQD